MTRFAIERSRITLIAMAVVAAAGYQAYVGMPRAEDPGFIIRTALVMTRLPGASPERVEQLITNQLEKVIQEMPEIDFLRSESKPGVSEIYVNILESYRDMRPIWDSLRRKVSGAAASLPDGVIGPIVNDEFGDVFGTIVTISGRDFGYAEIKEIADEVRDQLLLIPEVAKVEIYGEQDERIFVEYNNARLSELGLSPGQLVQILGARNIVSPGGRIETASESIVLEPTGNFETLDDLRRTVINLPGTRELLLLQDVAAISRGTVDPPRSLMRTNGQRSLALAISLREGGNILELGDRVAATIDRVRSFYPVGIEFGYLQFQANNVAELIDGFIANLVQAVAIVTVVMLVFLGLRTGLVVATLIPMAMLAALMVMDFFAIGLDQMSIASLIIALGLLVDNAIVMSESILVQMEEGKERVAAAVDSANELRVPLLTSSLTTAAAFLPIFLAENATGEYTAPIFKVVTITLLASWVIALTLIPLLCVFFLKAKASPAAAAFDSRFYRWYRGTLLLALRYRYLTLALVAAMFVGAMSLFALVPKVFFPPNSRATMTVELELPAGSPIEATRQLAEQFDAYVADDLVASGEVADGVLDWSTFIGRGAPRFMLSFNPEQQRSEYALMLLNVTSRDAVDVLAPRIEAWGRERFPDLDVTARPLEIGPPSWPPIEVRISGRDTERIFDIVEQIKTRVREFPGTKTIGDDWGVRAKKLRVEIDQPRALRAGVSSQDIAISLQTFLSGIQTTEFREDDQIIPVTLRSVESQRTDIDRLEGLNVYSQSTGNSVPLSQVADLTIAWEPSNIIRRDRLRTVSVQAGLEPGFTAAAVNAPLIEWLESHDDEWGLGLSWELGGEVETSSAANAAIAAKVPVAAMLIVLLLVAQFNSIRRPAIILMTIPLGLIGVILALLASQLYFGFMTLLGIISLAGIVINNAIVLIDRIDQEIAVNGLAPDRAIIESAQRRLRPIVMTTCTTIGGLVPLYLGGGPMWEPLAMTIMGGLLFATVLTLGVVPTLYAVLFRVDFNDFRY